MSESRLSERGLLLRVEEAGTLLGIGRTSVYGLIDAGALPAVHIGRSVRIPRRAVEEFIDRLAANHQVPSHGN